MFLKNYTSDVPVNQTVFEIEKILLQCGVGAISKDYNPSGRVMAVTFTIKLPNTTDIPVRIPVNEEAAIDALWLDYVDGDKLTADGSELQWHSRKKKKRADFVEQGRRTAWRLMLQWIEVQMSLIQCKQADFREIFLPYFWDGKRTYYQAIKDHGMAGFLPERT